ncbi:MAG: type II secretion system F family protein [Firmicutes bacterium]|nr:type II secretion system F family protein [Bacillota bacterium]
MMAAWWPWVLAIGWPLVVLWLVLAWRQRSLQATVNQRLYHFVGDRPSATQVPRRRLAPLAWRERWRQGTSAAALKLRPSEYALFLAGAFLVPFGFGFALRGIGGGLILGVLGTGGLYAYFRIKQQRWLHKAEEQLPEFLRGVASALRAGSSLSQAMHLVAEEMPEPLGAEISRVLRREALGFNFGETLEELARRIPSREMGLAVMAINIQREVGGSLADLLDTITETISDRQRLKTEIRVLTAQGRFSGWTLTAMPFVLSLLIWFADPRYIGPLFESLRGWGMLAAAFCLIVIGGVVINRLVRAPEM